MHHAFSKNKVQGHQNGSAVHVLSRYFTYILLSLAAITAIYWGIFDTSKILPSVSAMLIVACPCALLLAATYTNGNLLRLLSINGLFLRDASVIEQIGNIDHVVFDKTGTLTHGSQVSYAGAPLSGEQKDLVYTVARSSRHPYSQAIAGFLLPAKEIHLTHWKEIPGEGIEASTDKYNVRLGATSFTGIATSDDDKAIVHVNINNEFYSFRMLPGIRQEVPSMLSALGRHFTLSLLSGDSERQRSTLAPHFAPGADLLFGQKPIDKLRYIEQLQQKHHSVLMVGDGLNDAGALQQSNVGITLADDINNFTPSCDAILDAHRFSRFPALLRFAASGKIIIRISFAISILYNIIGLFIAVQGLMNPMIAAILMPLSTLTIVLLTTGMSTLFARICRLSLV